MPDDSHLLALFTPASEANSPLERLSRIAVTLKTKEGFEKSIAGTKTESYANMAGAELSSLFVPYETYATSGSMPMFPNSSGLISAAVILTDLIPFKPMDNLGRTDRFLNGSGYHDSMNGVLTGSGYQGDLDRYRDYSHVRSIGHRLPMVGVGWGFDLEDNPVPAGSGDMLFKGELPSGYMVDPKDYQAAPIDFRFDSDRGVWTCIGMDRHRHLLNSRADGGPAFAGYFR